MDLQIQQYVPILILGLVALAFAGGNLVLSVLLGKSGRLTKTKDSAYECGMQPVGEGNSRLSVKFYLIAMLFILFDIEVIFMFPWAVVYKSMLANPATTNVIFFSMLSFIGVLVVGYVYAFKKRAFDWKSG